MMFGVTYGDSRMAGRSTLIQPPPGLTIIFILLSMSISLGNCQNCATVHFEGVQCASAGDLTLQCPMNHVIEIASAEPKTLFEPGCTTDLVAAEDACSIEPLTSYVNNQVCGGATEQSCTISATLWGGLSLSKCAGYNGDNIMHYKYKCIPVPVLIEMCEPVRMGGSLVELTSSSTGNTDCMCVIEAPQDTGIVIERVRFDLDPQVYSCDQRVVISGADGEMVTMCRTNNIFYEAPCDDDFQNISIHYETDGDPSAQIEFQIDFTVRYDKTFTIECGLTYTPPTTIPDTTLPATTSTSISTTETDTTPMATTETTTTTPTTTTSTTTLTTTMSTTIEPSMTTSEPTSPSLTSDPGDGDENSVDVSGSTLDDPSYVLGMSRAMLIGLVVGVVAFIFIVTGVAALIAFSRKNKEDEPRPSTSTGGGMGNMGGGGGITGSVGSKLADENVYDEVKMYNVSNGNYEQPLPTLQRSSKQNTPLPAPPAPPPEPMFYPAVRSNSPVRPSMGRDRPKSPTRERRPHSPRPKHRSPTRGRRKHHSPTRERHQSPTRHHHRGQREPSHEDRPRSPRTRQRAPPSPRVHAKFPADEDIAHNPLYGRALELYNY